MEEALRDLEEAIRRLEKIREIIKGTRGNEAQKVAAKDFDPKKLIKIVSAIANLERMIILREIASGGKYFTELLEITGLTNSSLYFHLRVLQEAGIVRQEYQRGKYLLTDLGEKVFEALCDMYEKCRRWIE